MKPRVLPISRFRPQDPRWTGPAAAAAIMAFAAGCVGAPIQHRGAHPADAGGHAALTARLDAAEGEASAGGRQVLRTGRQMILTECVVAGACWDYINAVYDRAGYDEDHRTYVFKNRKAGPYADDALIRAGDWLYIVNHASNNIEHSVMFVAWSDRGARKGLVLTYSGRSRAVPARYQVYDLSSVYTIIRPGGLQTEEPVPPTE